MAVSNNISAIEADSYKPFLEAYQCATLKVSVFNSIMMVIFQRELLEREVG